MKKWIILSLLIITGFLIVFKKDEWIEEKIEQIVKGFSTMYKTVYDNLYKYYGNLRNIDWRLIKAIAVTESSETADAIGDDNRSFGLMQVSLIVGSSYGMSKDDLLIPAWNVQVGSGFLKDLIEKYGLEGGIQAYNLGETKFRKGLTSPTYLKKVLGYYEEFKIIYT